MTLTIKIEAKTKKNILTELNDIKTLVEIELNDPVCKGCQSCKDPEKGCVVSGGNSDPVDKIESEWNLSRKYVEHKNICKSKNKKTD